MKPQGSPTSQFQDQNDSGTIALTGASPVIGVAKDVADASTGVLLGRIKPGSLSASVSWNIKATSLTYTASWQVSKDGSTWRPFVDMNDAVGVVFATGTGSDVAGGPLVVAGHDALMAYPHVRLVVTTGGSATGVVGHDNVDVKYNFALQDVLTE